MLDQTIYSDTLERTEADPSRVTIRLFTWGETAQTPQGPERFARGSLKWDKVTLETQRHGGDLVGAMEDLEEREDGPYATFRVSDTQEGRDTLRLVQDGVLGAASIVFKPNTAERGPDGATVRTSATLRRVALIDRGAYPSAAPVEVREDMTDQTPAPEVAAYDDSVLLARMDTQDQALARVEALATAKPADQAEEEVRTWADLWDLTMERPADAEALLGRALADNTFAVSGTGLTGTANISTIVEPIAAKRRSINAMGIAGLPAIGMTVDYITFDKVASTGYQALVTLQGAEKDEIGTGVHAWDPASAAIATYAGGSDNSWQLLQRSEPSFRNLLLRQYASEWAYRTNAVFAGVLEAGTNTDTLTLSGADDAVDAGLLRSKLVAQSIAIETETGSPANVVLAASDVFQRIAENTELFPAMYGTSNVSGTADAATLNVSVAGLNIVHEPMLTSGLMLTSRGGGEVAEWRETFKGIVTQDQVANLGTDIAVWGYGASLLYRQAGLFVTTVTLA